MSDSFAEASRLGDDWCGAEHLLLALIRGDSSAGDAFRASGVTPERVEELIAKMRTKDRPRRSGVSSNPHWHQVTGRAAGLAAARGATAVEPIDTVPGNNNPKSAA